MEGVEKHANHDGVSKVLIANKCDEAKAKRAVSTEEVRGGSGRPSLALTKL